MCTFIRAQKGSGAFPEGVTVTKNGQNPQASTQSLTRSSFSSFVKSRQGTSLPHTIFLAALAWWLCVTIYGEDSHSMPKSLDRERELSPSSLTFMYSTAKSHHPKISSIGRPVTRYARALREFPLLLILLRHQWSLNRVPHAFSLSHV